MIRHTLLIAALPALLFLAATAPAQPAGGAFARSEPRAVDLAAVRVNGADGIESPLDAVVPRGPVVLHFWATWCVPCREELPLLDAFRAELMRDGLADRLLLVSVDRFGFEKIEAFLKDDLGLSSLPTLQARSRRAGSVFRLFGYPVTLLLDGEHREVGRHAGPLAWDDAAVRAELVAHLTAER